MERQQLVAPKSKDQQSFSITWGPSPLDAAWDVPLSDSSGMLACMLIDWNRLEQNILQPTLQVS